MKTVTIHAEIPAYLRDALAQLPGPGGQSESDMIADALREYVDGRVPRLRDLKAALAAAGGAQSEEDAVAAFARNGAFGPY